MKCLNAHAFRWGLERRRSVRDFSEEPVPQAVVQELVRAASTAPSGANKQPWTFVAVCDPAMTRRIREAAEEKACINYSGRMDAEWIEDLKPLRTDARKPYLEIAPWLLAVFKRAYEVDSEGRKRPHYYVNESVGIATSMLLTAAHHAGLVALTHTPSPMNFLASLLGRPSYERPYLLIPIGFPSEDCRVPDIAKKRLDQVLVVHK